MTGADVELLPPSLPPSLSPSLFPSLGEKRRRWRKGRAREEEIRQGGREGRREGYLMVTEGREGVVRWVKKKEEGRGRQGIDSKKGGGGER